MHVCYICTIVQLDCSNFLGSFRNFVNRICIIELLQGIKCVSVYNSYLVMRFLLPQLGDIQIRIMFYWPNTLKYSFSQYIQDTRLINKLAVTNDWNVVLQMQFLFICLLGSRTLISALGFHISLSSLVFITLYLDHKNYILVKMHKFVALSGCSS